MKQRILITILFICISLLNGFSQGGMRIGTVSAINEETGEIVIASPDFSPKIKAGEKFYLLVGERAVVMKWVFVTQKEIKCRLEERHKGYLGSIAKGMPVYRYHAGIDGEKKGIHKADATKTIGGIEFVYIKGGGFLMGNPEGTDDYNENPQRKVTVSSFWMGKYEVTQDQYQNIMGNNPSHHKGDGTLPAEMVSWHSAKEFCRKFSGVHHVSARLPTEAEWEYACRAGTKTRYYWGDEINGEYCWHGANSERKTHPVGQKLPNAWGLFDMSGNVIEWCEDWSGEISRKFEVNPKGPNTGTNRVCRGGSMLDDIRWLQSAKRNLGHDPESIYNEIGFRLVIPAGDK